MPEDRPPRRNRRRLDGAEKGPRPAEAVVAAGPVLTAGLVPRRTDTDRLERIVDPAVGGGDDRIEPTSTRYHG